MGGLGLVRRPQIVVLTVLLVAAACGDDDGGSSVETTTQSPPPTTVASPDVGPVLVGLVIHAEGFRMETTNQDQYRIHRDGLAAVADAAERNGAVLQFDLSPEFIEAHETWGDDFIGRLVAAGHGVGFHADAGGDDPPLQALVARIEEGVERLRTLGIEEPSVSGICSRTPWVEAAVIAGVGVSSGAVEYCLTAVDEPLLPPGKADVAACPNPSACHGNVFDDLEERLYPLRAASARRWVRNDPWGPLLILIGESASSIDCLSDGATGGSGCRLDRADIDLFLDQIAAYEAARTKEEPATLVMSWSIGSLPDAEVADALFRSVAEVIEPGVVEWATVAEMASAFPVPWDRAGTGLP